ncbi:MAG: hypothetical protein AAF492_20275, partial [Verrucomicrobiota bacterium]
AFDPTQKTIEMSGDQKALKFNIRIKRKHREFKAGIQFTPIGLPDGLSLTSKDKGKPNKEGWEEIAAEVKRSDAIKAGSYSFSLVALGTMKHRKRVAQTELILVVKSS